MTTRWQAGHRIPKPLVAVTRPTLPGESLQRLGFRGSLRTYPESRPLGEDELIAFATDAAGLICQSSDRVTSAVVASLPSLQIVSTVSVGVDHLDLRALSEAGILATNTPGVLSETTADMAWALILAARRRVVEADRLVHAGGWNADGFDLLPALDVHGATLGIVGFGAVGQAVARRATGFAMKVLYHARHAAPGVGAQRVPLDELLSGSDIVSVHLALNPDTRGLIGEREISRMKPTAVLVNTSRGAIVDQSALGRALAERRIMAAALDVTATEPIPPDDPLLQLGNCIVLPHIASATVATRSRMADLAVGAVETALDGRLPDNIVNRDLLEPGG